MHIQHVGIAVRDAEAARRFYTEAFDLVELPRPDFGIPGHWLADPRGAQIHILQLDDATPFPAGVHVAFEVDDIDAARARLAELGVASSEPRAFQAGAARQSVLHDPDGNMIELNQPPR